MIKKAIDLLRRAIDQNAMLVERLHGAIEDLDAVRNLLHELDANNADLHVALEEIAEYPPPLDESLKSGTSDNGAAS